MSNLLCLFQTSEKKNKKYFSFISLLKLKITLSQIIFNCINDGILNLRKDKGKIFVIYFLKLE